MLVLLVKAAPVLTGVDQLVNQLSSALLVLLVNAATVELGVDQSCKTF